MNISKSDILNPESGDNAAVKLALARDAHHSGDQKLSGEPRRASVIVLLALAFRNHHPRQEHTVWDDRRPSPRTIRTPRGAEQGTCAASGDDCSGRV